MKFRLKKFIQDRNKSTEGSKKGDYKLIESNEGRDNITEIITNIQHSINPIDCQHLKVGCELPYPKRIKPQCQECYSR